MSTNQYRGREETNKIDFGRLGPEKQKEISKQHITDEQDEESLNEEISTHEANKLDRERARKVN